MDPTTRLRLATRIHFALLRHYGENVAVGDLLNGEGDAREALWVCEASGHDELVVLAQRFTAAARHEARADRAAGGLARAEVRHAPAVPRGAVSQDLAWSRDTSGFGLSRPLELGEPAPSRWLSPTRWLRGSGPR